MENPEEVLHSLDEFAKLKPKDIPNELEEYLLYVASSGDPVYQWSLIKSLFRQKLLNVITEFYETCPMMDIPPCPNVDPFNYETMKNSLLERFDSFASAPFTIQRISELLTTPRKQYNRVDKFMRAIEKNIWVVSTREPGRRDSTNAQDTSNLVNGMAPQVLGNVTHPKKGRSIEERIKSGHPQLIDDDDEEEEDEEVMDCEAELNAELLQSVPGEALVDPSDAPLQSTSVKDLIDKYESGTVICNNEDKAEYIGKTTEEEESEAKGIRHTDAENNSDHESDEDAEETHLEKAITLEPSSEVDTPAPSEDDKIESAESDSTNEVSGSCVSEAEVAKGANDVSDDGEVGSVEPPNYLNDDTKPDTTDRTDENSSSNEESVSVTEVTESENEVENNDNEPILEEPDSEESINVIETTQNNDKEEINEAEVKTVLPDDAEAEAAGEKEEYVESSDTNKTKRADDHDSPNKKLATESRILLELEADSSSSPDDTNIEPPLLSETPGFIDIKETAFEKSDKKVDEEEEDEIEEEDEEEEATDKRIAPSESSEAASVVQSCTNEAESSVKVEDFIRTGTCLQASETHMDENDVEEKSNDMIVEESEKVDEMEVDDLEVTESCSSSPMVQEEASEPMDDSEAAAHS